MAAANEKQWREFWQRLGAHGDAMMPWQELRAAYTEPWRAYHNLGHIGHCLEEFAAVRKLANDPLSIEVAIWFHDVIYDTHGKDNEERSADFAEAVLRKAGQPKSFTEAIRDLILATKHQAQPAANDARLLVDIDLAILGQPLERYTEFEQQIRREYAWVSNPDFAAGRSAILNGFLNRERIFASPDFIQKYEQPARANLTWAIKRLAR